MLKTLSFAATVALALGACPNQCSGHGYCDENDRCICFRAPGTKGGLRDAYTGADCSQRVCPYGRSFDVISDSASDLLAVNFDASLPEVSLYKTGNPASQSKLRAFLNNGFLLPRDLGLDVQVVSVDAPNNFKFSWKTNTEKTFNTEVMGDVTVASNQYSSRKTAYHVKPNGKDSGLYIYFDLTTTDLASASQTIYPSDFYSLNVTYNNGISFTQDDHNNAHGNIECSGRGVCDRAVGTCKCVEGYTGDACQRTECPNDCSGHGTCQSQYYFVKDAATTVKGDFAAYSYDAFDKDGQMGCKCDDGFRGADCSQAECPSGPDPLKGDGGAEGRDCSGRGICDFSTGVCQCHKGFFGERCESQTNLV